MSAVKQDRQAEACTTNGEALLFPMPALAFRARPKNLLSCMRLREQRFWIAVVQNCQAELERSSWISVHWNWIKDLLEEMQTDKVGYYWALGSASRLVRESGPLFSQEREACLRIAKYLRHWARSWKAVEILESQHRLQLTGEGAA